MIAALTNCSSSLAVTQLIIIAGIDPVVTAAAQCSSTHEHDSGYLQESVQIQIESFIFWTCREQNLRTIYTQIYIFTVLEGFNVFPAHCTDHQKPNYHENHLHFTHTNRHFKQSTKPTPPINRHSDGSQTKDFWVSSERVNQWDVSSAASAIRFHCRMFTNCFRHWKSKIFLCLQKEKCALRLV